MEEETKGIQNTKIETDKIRENRKLKVSLIRDGFRYVKPEAAKKWVEIVRNNTNDDLSTFVLIHAISMMKELDAGNSFNEAEQQVYIENSELVKAVTNILEKFSKQGKEYKEYRNTSEEKNLNVINFKR